MASVTLLISFYSCSAAIRFLDVCLILTTLTYTSEAFYLLAVQTITVRLPTIVFAALRMYALYGLSKPVFSIVLVIGLISPGTQIVSFISSNTVSAQTLILSAVSHD